MDTFTTDTFSFPMTTDTGSVAITALSSSYAELSSSIQDYIPSTFSADNTVIAPKVHYIVSRFDLDVASNIRIVGFTLTKDESTRTEYVECKLNLNACQGKSDSEVCDMAFALVREDISTAKSKLENNPIIVGKEYIPSSDV
jgi:hypothetical protein